MSEDKTRILTAEEAERWAGAAEQTDDKARLPRGDETARGPARATAGARDDASDREPQFVGDKIVFFCPNGHKITVSRSLAGKHGNCSKQGCGAPVVIPGPPGFKPAPPAAGAVVRSPEPAAAERVDAAAAPDAPPAPPEVEASADDAAAWNFTADGPPAAAGAVVDEPSLETAAGWTFDLDQLENPTARLVARLWLERSHGGVVEVHLSGGGVIMPEWYDPQWSSGTHAVFAALAADGTLTLTAVAWDQVQKVVVRQVQGTPDGMFEG